MTSQVPTLTARVDWSSSGNFSGGSADISSRVISASWDRGRSGDFSTEATGQATLVLNNQDGFFTAGLGTSLIPGRPVHIYSTWSATDYPLFYGYVQTISPDPATRQVTIQCYDVLQRMSEVDVNVPANPFVQYSARDLRIAVLSDFERGQLNLIPNPSFEANVNEWTVSLGGTLTRVTGDSSGQGGTACAEWVSGATATPNIGAIAYLAPVSLNGEVYRFTPYLKSMSGTTSFQLSVCQNGAVITTKLITVTGSWAPYTITGTMTADAPAAGKSAGTGAAKPLTLKVTNVSSPLVTGTLRIDTVAVTRGQGQYPYADVGTGRWPNYVANSGFDGQVLNGWYDGWTNLCNNGNFETNATGWVNVSRSTAVAYNGTHCGEIAKNTTGTFNLPGTYLAGQKYRITAAVSTAVSNPGASTIGLRSSGTPSDNATVGITTVGAMVTVYSVDWTPNANRTNAQIYAVCDNATSQLLHIDIVQVWRVDFAAVGTPNYSDVGTGGQSGSFVTSRAISQAQSLYGNSSQAIVTPATAGSGRVFDFNLSGAYFVAGVQYVNSIWVYPTSNMPYQAGVGFNKYDGTAGGTVGWDSATTSGTAIANQWNQITWTWTPAQDASSAIPFGMVSWIWQTDTTARTFYVDGVRTIPGSTADLFELPQWNIPNTAEPDVYASSASLTGNFALPSLSTINSLTLSRHWIQPTMSSPWYQYTVEDRATYAAKTSAEVLTDDVTVSLQWGAMSAAQIDRASIINVLPIGLPGTTEYYSDPTSVTTYGEHPASAIAGANFYPDRTLPDTIGPILVARYKDPRARPSFAVGYRFPSQLQRQLNDMVTVTFSLLSISARKYVIAILSTQVSTDQDGQQWTTTWTLEEYPT